MQRVTNAEHGICDLTAVGALCLTVCSPRETVSFWWNAHAAPTQLAQDLQNRHLAHPGLLGIHPYVHPGRTRCMRHGLPHAWRIGRGMLLLLLPLRAVGYSRTGKFVDRAVAAGTLEHSIASSVDHSRHLAVAWHIFPTVPGVPLRIDLGGDGHAANLQHPRHAPLRHFHAVRVNLFPDNACEIL